MSRRIVVIGSNSFSGSDLVDLLLESNVNEVIGISRSPEKDDLFLPYKRHKEANFKFFQYDLNQNMPEIVELLDKFQPEFIINFAAQSEVGPSWDNPGQWFQTNAVAITELARYLKSVPYLKRYVHISSPEVYGSCVGTVTESAPLNPSTPYAASKAAGDLSLFTFVKNFNFPMCMVRATNVYGPHQQLFKIIPRSIIYIKKRIPVELHGGGKAVKSYIHIRDVSQGEVEIMENGKPGAIYHLSPDKGVPVREVVTLIASKMGFKLSDVARNVGERLGQDSAYVIDSTRAREELKWKPKITLEKGIEEVIAWVDKYWDRISEQSLEYVHKA